MDVDDNRGESGSALKPDRALAVVLGASEWPYYPGFSSSASFRRSAHEVARYFRSPKGLNIPEANVCVQIDAFESAQQIMHRVRNFIRQRRDYLEKCLTPVSDLLIYYVGHGGFEDDTFFLSVRETHKDDPLATSIMSGSLSRLIQDHARGLRTYIVLDCCYAASLASSLMSGGLLRITELKLQEALPPQGDVRGETGVVLPEYGIALLCACGAHQWAQAPPHLKYTMFTGGLLDILSKGDPRSPRYLSLNDVVRSVRNRLAEQFEKGVPLPEVHTPQQRAGRLDLVPLFRNPSPRLQTQTRPSKIRWSDEAVAVFDDLVLDFSNTTEVPAGRQTAMVLRSKGKALGVLGRKKDAIAVFDDLILRFGNSSEAPILDQISLAFRHKWLMLCQLGQNEEAIAVCNDFIRRYGAATETSIRKQVAIAFRSKGIILMSLGRFKEEIAVYDDLFRRFGNAPEVPIRRQVATALLHKASRLDMQGCYRDAIIVYDNIAIRFGVAHDTQLQRQAALALRTKSEMLYHLRYREKANQACDCLIGRFGRATDEAIREQVSMAFRNKEEWAEAEELFVVIPNHSYLRRLAASQLRVVHE